LSILKLCRSAWKVIQIGRTVSPTIPSSAAAFLQDRKHDFAPIQANIGSDHLAAKVRILESVNSTVVRTLDNLFTLSASGRVSTIIDSVASVVYARQLQWWNRTIAGVSEGKLS